MRTRLTFPARFRGEKQALGVIRDNALFPVGAQAVELDGEDTARWRIVIDTFKPDAVSRYLEQQGFGVWHRTEFET